jgi:hypothetical protein
MGVGWGNSVQLESNPNGDAYYPVLLLDSSGTALAVWYQYHGSHYNIYSSRYE